MDKVLDLSGVECPANFIKVKLQLEKMSAGQQLIVILDDGEPMDSVPRSLMMEGHDVCSEEMLADGRAWKLVIQKAKENTH